MFYILPPHMSNEVAISHMWPLNTWNVASVTEESFVSKDAHGVSRLGLVFQITVSSQVSGKNKTSA